MLLLIKITQLLRNSIFLCSFNYILTLYVIINKDFYFNLNILIVFHYTTKMTFLIEIIASISLGILFGLLTGLLPGIHPNTVAVSLLTLSPLLLQFASPLILAVFIVVVATTNTISDSLPSIYFGAPDSDSNAMQVLPGHKLLLQGKGHEALVLTVIGSLAGLFFSILLTPLLIIFLDKIFPITQKYLAFLLIIASAILIIREKSKLLALTIFILSGVLGLVSAQLNVVDYLFPLFSGLFGIPTQLMSLKSKTKIPEQNISYPNLDKNAPKAIIASIFSGSLVSILPGLGNGQAAILGSTLIKEIDSKNFLIMLGGINTVNFIISFASLYAIDRARNGAIVAVSKIISIFDLNTLLIFISVAIIAGCLSAITTIQLSKKISVIITKVNYYYVNIVILFSILILVTLITGYLGLLILIISVFIGLLPILTNVSRSQLMGSLIIPVILFFL